MLLPKLQVLGEPKLPPNSHKIKLCAKKDSLKAQLSNIAKTLSFTVIRHTRYSTFAGRRVCTSSATCVLPESPRLSSSQKSEMWDILLSFRVSYYVSVCCEHQMRERRNLDNFKSETNKPSRLSVFPPKKLKLKRLHEAVEQLAASLPLVDM